MRSHVTITSLVWIDGLDSWDRLMKGIVMKGVPLEFQITNLKQQPVAITISWLW